MKKLITIMLAFVLIMTNVHTVQGETTVNGELRNPRMVADATMDAKQKVSWDVVTFGSYPQAEIVSTAGKESYSAILPEVLREGDVIADDTVYQKLSQLEDSAWDEDGDTELDGVRYRRMNYKDAEEVSRYPSSLMYDWGGVLKNPNAEDLYYETMDDSYHYFKYEPIRWRVLEAGDEILLLSDIILEAVGYASENWDSNEARNYLNGYHPYREYFGDYEKSFMDVAFSEDEKTAIITSHLDNKEMTAIDSWMCKY